MDSMEINKGVAAVLVAGIVFFLTGLIGMQLVSEKRLEKPAIAIQGAPAEATAGAPKPEALPPIAPLLAKADVATGESTAKKLCTSCHTFTQGGKGRRRSEPVWRGRWPAWPYGRLQLLRRNEGKERPLDVRRVERVAAQAVVLCAGHADGVRRHQQRPAARGRDRTICGSLSPNPVPLPSP